MEKFKPESPDNNLNKPADMTLARFGHLNKVVEEVNAVKASTTATGVTAAASAAILAAAAANIYADNAAALAGGLTAGKFYHTVTGELRIVV